MSENQEQAQTTDDLDAFSTEFFGQNESEPEAEVPTSTDTEGGEEEAEPEVTEDAAEQDEDQGESTESQDTDEEETEDEPEEAPKKGKPSVQERINELVRQREEAKREGQAALEALRAEFEEKLAALKAESPAKPAEDQGEPTPADVNPDGTPKYELGEFDPQFIRDLTKYTLAQEKKAMEAAAAEQAKQAEATKAQQALATAWNEKVTAAVAEKPDFMEKGQALLAGFDSLPSDYAQYLSTVLMSMDKGPDVLYYLANNPDEARQIVNSGAQKATLALGRIEAKFIEDAARKTLAKPKQSKAPPPPPAQARSRGSNGAFVAVAPDTDDLDAFTAEFFKKK